MIQFTKINIEGFASIPELSLDLNTQGITIIRGVNGEGKSSIFSALVWGLYGKNLKGNSNVNTWEKVRPKNYKGTKVEIYFIKDNQVHQIIRCQNYKGEVDGAKGGSRLIYNIDLNPVQDKYKLKIQDLINKNLEMSYNLFINSVMFGQGLTRLIEASGSDQRKLFEEIFEIGYLIKARDLAKVQYDKYSEEYNRIVYKQDVLKKQIAKVQESIEYSRKYEKVAMEEKERQLASLRNRKSLSTKELRELTPYVHEERTKYLEDQIKETQEFIQTNKKKLSQAKDKVGISLEELIDQIIRLLEDNKICTAMSQLRELKASFSKIESCNQKIDTLNKALYRLKDEYHQIEVYKIKISKIKAQLKNCREMIRSWKKRSVTVPAGIRQKEQLKELQEELNKLDKGSIEHTRDLYKWAYTDPLGNGGIKAFLFESSLDSLNKSLDTYSSILGFSIFFGVDMETARKDFHIYINMEGQDVPFEDLSGGQKQLVNLAIAFAMNEILSQSKQINIAFLDEVFESLSSNNIELVSELIRKIYKNKTLFLITHQESLPINAKTLKVKRINGLSHYEF